MNVRIQARPVRIVIALSLVFALLLGGCGAVSGPNATRGSEPGSDSGTGAGPSSGATAGAGSGASAGAAAGVDLMAKVRAAKRPENPGEPSRALVESVGGFSWTLFQKVAEKKGNLTLSPASTYLALAMTLNGVEGTTRTAMLKAMAAEGLPVDAVNAGCRDWVTLLMQVRDAYGNKDKFATDLKIAHSIWYSNGFTADPVFLQTNADHFGAAARQLDFGSKDAVKAINGWVEQATGGKIKTIMERIGPNDVLYLISAVYFKSLWQKQFNRSKTHPADFLTDGGTVSATYMSDEFMAKVLDRDGLRGILLPFLNERFAFLAALPPEGTSVRQAVARMDAAAFERLLNTRREASVTLDIPKFDATFETDLMSDLARMGMGIAFGADADLSLMDKNRQKGLYISGVKHKTWFRIDEYGAEAAGVTGVTAAGAIIKKDDRHLVFDRPFLYGIVDVVTGLPLFLGIMDNPTR